MGRRRVLLVLSDTGFGHRAAANAIAAATRDLLGADSSTEVVDVYGELEVPLLAGTPALYGLVSRHGRPLFDLAFGLTDRPAAGPVLARGVSTAGLRRVGELLASRRPDTVVVCNPLHMGELFAAARRRAGLDFDLVTVVTDPVSVHASWFSTGVDLHFLTGASHPAMTERVACLDVPFPVHPSFARAGPGRRRARELLGLDPDRPVALLAGGGAGAGSRRSWRALLHALAGAPDVQLLVAAGTNGAIVSLLRRSRFAAVRVLAPTGSLELPLRASSVMFSKAGPASIFEAAALGVPLRLFDEVGMQERGNTAYARALGVAEPLGAGDPVTIVRRAEDQERRPRPDLTCGARAVAAWIAAS